MAEKKMVDVFSDVERETAMTANPAGFAVTELGAEDERIVTLAADMSNTVAEFIARFPERYIEVGIAETNSVSLAAGLASAGLIPYIYSMSPFGMLKTCEQWRTDVTTTTCRSAWSAGCPGWRWGTSGRRTTRWRTSRSRGR
jgi:transketolase